MKNLTDCTKVMVRDSMIHLWTEAFRDSDGLFYDLRGNEIRRPWAQRSGWDHEAEPVQDATANASVDQAMAQMMCAFERGRTVAPTDGDNAIAPSGEAYVTFALQLSFASRDDDYSHEPSIELIAALGGVLEGYRQAQPGKYLRWRKRPTIEKDHETGIMKIRCRVLISTHREAIFEIERDVAVVTETPPEPLHYPVPEPCSNTFNIVPGYVGASGKFYDEYGVPLRKPPVGWGPRS